MLHVPGLYIAETSDKGRGVFTAMAIGIGDIVEICPVVFISKAELSLIDQTIVHDYYFLWPGEEAEACIALGYGSLYNHDARPNAEVRFDLGDGTLTILCLTDIEAGDEILIDYQGGIKHAPALWF